MITWSSISWMVRKKVITGYRRVIERVHVSDQKIKNFITMGVVVNELAKLRRKEKVVIWLVTVEFTKKEKLGFWVLHFEKMIVA